MKKLVTTLMLLLMNIAFYAYAAEPVSFYVDLNTNGGVYGSGGTYGHLQVDGESILVTKDRQVFEGRKSITELVAAFIANNPDSVGANEHQKGYKAEAVEGKPTFLKITPISGDDNLTADQTTFSFLGLEGFVPNGAAGIQPLNNAILLTLDTVVTPPAAEPVSFYVDLNTNGGVYGSGGTYGHLQVDGESILVTKDRQVFEGRKSITELVAAFIANNPDSVGANEHQKGYKAEAVEGKPTFLKITPINGDDNLTADQTTFSFLGLEGWNPAGAAGIQPLNNAILLTLDTVVTPPAAEPVSFYVDLNTNGGVYGSGGTYGHIQVDGESILVTKDRQEFDGRKSITELVAAFIANNPGSEGANEHQKGYKAEAVEGEPTFLKITPINGEDNLTEDQTTFSFLGLEGWTPAGAAGIQPLNNVIFYTLDTVVTMDTVATPTFSEEAGEFEVAFNLEITSETEGATIYYTLDGSEPTAESTEYTEAIAIEATTTVKAIAIKEGMENSEVAEVVYTYSPVNVDATLEGQLVVFTQGNNIIVETAEGANVQVFSLTGANVYNEIATAASTSINVEVGVYVVKVDAKSVKVIVK